MHLDQFDEGARECAGMHERNPIASAAGPRSAIDEFDAIGFEMGEGCVDVGDLNGDVVEPLAPPIEKTPDRRVGIEWHEELQKRAAERNHRLLHPLLIDDLTRQGLHTKESRDLAKGLVEVTHRDRGVVQVQGKHPPRM